jgi:hypothetical protein
MVRDFPLLLISYNRLSYLRQQVDYFRSIGFSRIVILDNASTYEPLLVWLDQIETQNVVVERLKENLGPYALYSDPALFSRYAQDYYFMSDCDIIPDAQCPADFPEYFYETLRSNADINKVGFSLKLDDLPDHYALKSKVLKWERKFWDESNRQGAFFRSAIDTTFALYRPNIWQSEKRWWVSLRADKPYQALHLPWYHNTKELDAETLHYQLTVQKGKSSWDYKELVEFFKKDYFVFRKPRFLRGR